MNTTACVTLRHDLRSRWIGDLRAVFCVTCDCLCVAALSRDPLTGIGGRDAGPKTRASSGAHQAAALAATAGSRPG